MENGGGEEEGGWKEVEWNHCVRVAPAAWGGGVEGRGGGGETKKKKRKAELHRTCVQERK